MNPATQFFTLRIISKEAQRLIFARDGYGERPYSLSDEAIRIGHEVMDDPEFAKIIGLGHDIDLDDFSSRFIAPRVQKNAPA